MSMMIYAAILSVHAKKMLSHPLDNDSDCSDNEEGADYASVIQTNLSKVNVGSAEEELSGDSEDVAAKKIPWFNTVDFISSFVSHKVLTPESTLELYIEQDKKSMFNNHLWYLKKHFIKDRMYNFPHDIISLSQNKQEYLNQELKIEKLKEQYYKLLESAPIKRGCHIEER